MDKSELIADLAGKGLRVVSVEQVADAAGIYATPAWLF